MAISKMPEYKEYNIKEAMIYSLKFQEKIPVSIDDADITSINNTIDKTVEEILAGNYSKCNDTSKCYNCEYNKSICRRR